MCSQNRKALISPYTWLHGRLGHSCLCVIWVGVALWVRNWLQNKYVKSISMFTTKCSWSVIMRISVWTQNSGFQIEHILLNPLAKLYFGKNSSHRFDVIAKLVKDAYSPFCRHKILRTDDAVWLHLNFFKRVPSLRILTSDATDHKADRLPPPTVLIFAFFSFLLTSCPIHLILVSEI